MLRTRLAVVILAGGLGFVSGCSSFCGRSLFHRDRGCPEVIDLGVTSVGEGPALEGSAPFIAPAPAPVGNSNLTPQATVPPLSTPPRLVPQPQSQPVPYTP